MFGPIAIPIWTRDGGGVESINEPGTYILYVKIPVPEGLIGKSINVPLTNWRATITDIKPWSGGSKVYTEIGPQSATVAEARLSPLQINLFLGIGLFAAFALVVDRISKVSPMMTVAIYGVILVVAMVVYVRYVHPLLKRKR